MLQAKGEHILIEPVDRADVLARQLNSRIAGFEYAKGHTKEGYPNIGKIYTIGDGCPDDLGYKVGDMVVFDVALVDGFEFEGTKLFPAHWKSPQAVVKGDL